MAENDAAEHGDEHEHGDGHEHGHGEHGGAPFELERPPDFGGKAAPIDTQLAELPIDVHRRIVDALNVARRHEDLEEFEACGLDHRVCQELLATRDAIGPYGYRSLQEIRKVQGLGPDLLAKIIAWFGPARYGRWTIRGQTELNGSTYNVAHAAVLRNGKVMFLPEADTLQTLIWDADANAFSLPVNAPTDKLFCAGHCFLSNGELLAVGGGGGGPSGVDRAWRFDPVANKWQRTAGDMTSARWYPTAVVYGWSRKVLVVSGAESNDTTDVYDESTDAFVAMQGPHSLRSFPQLYPGLHLLPGGEVFYTRTGFGSAGQGPGGGDPAPTNAYLKFGPPKHGEWVELQDTMEHTDRVRGMSVLLLRRCTPGVQVMVIGGTSVAGAGTAETLTLSTLQPEWGHASIVPGAETRVNVSAVLLPDGSVFVVGGTQDPAKPCARFNPVTGLWRTQARANYRKQYHSVAVLLPSAEVLATGGSNYGGGSNALEVFSPPYLFTAHGTLAQRPIIADAPDVIDLDHQFSLKTPQAVSIARVVLVRPMAVTHQTDTEQRVVELTFHRTGNKLGVSLPEFHHQPEIAPPGYYMLFIIDEKGVPSVARWIRLG
jgi:hypothetical protein